MPKTPRGKRVIDRTTGTYRVVNKAPNGQAEPYFDKSRSVWVAPWRKPDGKIGRPTGKTRTLAVASRDRHLSKAADDARFASLDEGFTADSTVADVAAWWLQNVARHRVRATTFATYRKQARLIEAGLGTVPARELRPEQVATFVSDLLDRGSASRARNVRTLFVQIMDQAVGLGLAADNVARQVKTPRVPRVRRRTVTPADARRRELRGLEVPTGEQRSLGATTEPDSHTPDATDKRVAAAMRRLERFARRPSQGLGR